MEGTFNVARKMFDGHDAFWPAPGTPHTRGEAWLDLVYQARFRPLVNSRFKVPRGAFAASLRELSDRWCWTIKQVRRFLEKCENLGRIRAHGRAHEGAHAPTVYVLVNYELYQPEPTEKGTREGTQPGQERAHYTRTKETKGEKNIYEADFDNFWRAYPKRAGANPRKPALKAYSARRSSGVSKTDLLNGANRYRRFCDATGKTGTEYVKQAQFWLSPSFEGWAQLWEISQPETAMGFDDSDFFTGNA